MSTYADNQRKLGRLTIAPIGALCQGKTPEQAGPEFMCRGKVDENGRNVTADAVHTWNERHYCAYHSPFDVTDQDRADLAARDDVPMGSNKADAGWTRRVESPIVRAEIEVRHGRRERPYLDAVVHEVGRKIKLNAFRRYQAQVKEVTVDHSLGLISTSYRNQMIREACDMRDGVSLIKA